MIDLSSLTPSRIRLWALAALAVLLLLAACSSCSRTAVIAEDFRVTLFTGGDFQLSDQIENKSVVLNFWYPSCPPCRAEMPAFQAAWEEVQDEDVIFLGLFVPRGLDSEQDARDFVADMGLTYDFATDSGGLIADSYRLEYFPKTYFIDKSGRVVNSLVAALEQQEIIRLVRAMDQG